MNSDGDQDSSIIQRVLAEINKDFTESVVIVKSTVLPSIIEKLSKSHKHFVYNPEFLREKTAKNTRRCTCAINFQFCIGIL